MMNETLNAIFDRRSIRSFTAQPLTQDELDTLVEVALASPTGMNAQPWQFQFITNQGLIADLNQAALDHFLATGNDAVIARMKARHESIFYGAPLLVVISMPKDNQDAVDAGIAVANLAIAAQSMGLGSCIIGLASAAFAGEHKAELAARLDWPEDHRFAISIVIGHAAMSKEAHDRRPEKVRVIG